MLGGRNGIKLKDKNMIEIKSNNENITLLNMIGDVKNKGDIRAWVESNGNENTINHKISIFHAHNFS